MGTSRRRLLLGKSAHMTCFVDSNHAGNIVTRFSHTGFLIYVMNMPIIWFSKKQNTVESSTFGSEFMAIWIARDLYKLNKFGVPLNGRSGAMCDNQGVVNNMRLSQYNLVKKHNEVNYQVVREGDASGILPIGKEYTQINLDDILTNILVWQ